MPIPLNNTKRKFTVVSVTWSIINVGIGIYLSKTSEMPVVHAYSVCAMLLGYYCCG